MALADLSINGLPLNLPPGADSVPKDYRDRFILPVVRTGNDIKFSMFDGSEITLTLGKELGSGVFGTVYNTDSVIDPGVPLIIKVLDYAPVIAEHSSNTGTITPADRINVVNNFKYYTLLESLSQIVVYNTTKTVRFPEINLEGPFAAKFYLLGTDAGSLYIVGEALDNTIGNLLFPMNSTGTERRAAEQVAQAGIAGHEAAKVRLAAARAASGGVGTGHLSRAVIDTTAEAARALRIGLKAVQQHKRLLERVPAKTHVFKTVILQMSKIFNYLYENLQFLHRDSKTDNIMYKMIDGRVQLRLIDFGRSCMTYHNVKIQTDNTFDGIIHCNSRIRDMYTCLWMIRNMLLDKNRLARDSDFITVLNIVLARGTIDARNWPTAYVFSNLDEPGAIANCDARAVYNIFNALEFTSDHVSSKITGPWYTELVLLVANYADKLSIEQLVKINPTIIVENTSIGWTGGTPFAKILQCADDPREFTLRFKDINEIMELKTIRNKAGQTALMLACALNNSALVERIRGIHGIKVAVQDNDGNTCLHFACRKASALKDNEAEWTKAVGIIEGLLRQNPILSEIRNLANQGPGNPAVSTDPRIRDYVKRVKTYWWHLKRNPDTNMGGGGTRRLGRRMRKQTRKR
jgi:hypothetical protein